ncbi:MlaA family lipoprotein [Spirabiliibacterium falconis]|uniref:MlaA family lipoprotein n=1 Tax=Spirabiliibacterium falconis TaxID=572023 RepID=UPI001AAD6B2B|nr:VacJ family lipoprotein [Spirabiliibacterium falconis]MBE2895132.1 VacJ family lipoprotein [Spirabiliibacterium falconis]
MFLSKGKALFCGLMLMGALSGCSSQIDPITGERPDPLQQFNRAMWDFNYKVADPYLLKPVAQGWKNHVPKPLTTALTNAANNLDEPASFVNRLLEGEFQKAMVHFNRFWLNSIFGLFGFMDIASASPPLQITNKRTFGDTLGTWGVGTGSYVMLPLYGPATPRQDLGRLVDYTYPTLSMLGPWSWLKIGIQAVDARAKLLSQDAILAQAQDPYLTVREAYFQNLEFKIHDGNGEKPAQEQLSNDILNDVD